MKPKSAENKGAPKAAKSKTVEERKESDALGFDEVYGAHKRR